MMRPLRTLLFWALGLGVLVATLIYGSGPADHYWLAAPGWSRAARVTTAHINAATPLAVDTDGTLYLFTVERDPARSDLALLRPFVRAFSARGQPQWQYRMPVVLDSPEQFHMLLVRDALHLFWLDEGQVARAVVRTDGTLDAAPSVLPAADGVNHRVNHYSVAADAAGRITLWTGGTRGEPGVYALALDDPGAAPVLVDAQGLYPQVRYDAHGALHGVWYRFPLRGDLQFFHGRYPGGALDGGDVQSLVAWPVRPRSELQAHAIGLDAETLYLFWTETVNTGAQIRGVETHFTHAAILAQRASPSASRSASRSATVPVPQPRPLRIPTPIDSPDGRFAFPDDAVPSDLAPARAVMEDVAVAFSAQVPGRQNRDVGQIGVLFLQDGAPTRAQLLSTSTSASFAPSLARDGAGEQYVTWLERATGGAGYHIYLAGTSAGLRAGLSQLTVNDVARVASNVIFNLATGALLGPVMLLLWLIGPLLVLILCRVGRGEWVPPMDAEFVGRTGAAIVVFWIGKLVTLPGLTEHVPFAAWVPVMPSLLGGVLRVVTPVTIGALSVVGARAFMRRVESPSPALFVTAYAVCDSVLTAAIYGSLLYARLFQGVLAAS